MTYVVIAAAVWLVIGAAVGVVQARRGHWRKGWIVAALLGPFAIPLSLQWRTASAPAPVVVHRGRSRPGSLDVLVGLDGSTSATAAADVALRLFGPLIRRVTLATVLDVDTAEPHADDVLYPDPWPEEIEARATLDAAATNLRARSGHEPGAVVLAGNPADALERYAVEEGYDVIVVGCRGRGLSKSLLGSCAAKLASATAVPVLIIPSDPTEQPLRST